MFMKSRMILKKELKAIAQSNYGIDKQVYDYYVNNYSTIGFSDREIVFMIHNILFRYEFNKDDYAIKIVDYLFNQTKVRNHRKFNEIYTNALLNNDKVTFELLLKNNVAIEEEVIQIAEEYLECFEQDTYYDLVDTINNYRNMIYILKQSARKQKIEKIRNKNRTKMINDLIISPLLLSKTTCN